MENYKGELVCSRNNRNENKPESMRNVDGEDD